uniref:Uncharacterized protein n=1 Tax=Syphacia muris TaxID=451379 RepID=A0A0N5AC13_9BILA
MLLLFFAFHLQFLVISSKDLDYSLECNLGYRVASFRRSPSVNNLIGTLTVECEQLESNVQCERLQSTPQCSGTIEGCSGNNWIGGFHAYTIENRTGAVLLEPICCSSSRIEIIDETCVRDRINVPYSKFTHSLAQDLIYRGMQCWHQYNTNNTLSDIIWKFEICSFRPPVLSPKYKGCRECDCKCGIDNCPDYTHPIKIIHKHYSSTSCGCECNCAFKCL